MNYYIFSNYEEKIFLKIKAWFFRYSKSTTRILIILLFNASLMSQSIQEIQKLRDEYRKFQNQGNNSMNSIEDIDNDISNAEMIEINNNEIVDPQTKCG